MKFLVDMPLSPKTVNFLKNMGFDAIRVSELGMAKAKDKDTSLIMQRKTIWSY
jgi:predicted nuclease of predicted toxin-antitoxin system